MGEGRLGTKQPHSPTPTFKKLAGSPCPAANGCRMPGRHTSAAGMALKSWLACKWAHSAHICRRIRHARFQMCMQQVHICNRMASSRRPRQLCIVAVVIVPGRRQVPDPLFTYAGPPSRGCPLAHRACRSSHTRLMVFNNPGRWNGLGDP